MAFTPDPVTDSDLKADTAALRPRQAAADAFEQNPLELIAEKLEHHPPPRDHHDDASRVREALRRVVQEGGGLDDTAKNLRVTPAALNEWRDRYYRMLREEDESVITGEAPLMDAGEIAGNADLTHIPATARLRFAENWERLLEVTEASEEDFRQSSWELFAQNSWLTSWLYHEGNLERGVLAGAACAVVGLLLTSSFLLADTAPPPLPPAAPAQVKPLRDDLLIDQAAETVQKFLQAPNWRERLLLTRQPERVRGLMEEFYHAHPDAPVTDAVLAFGINSVNISSLGFNSPSQNRSYLFKVVQNRGTGDMLVDWETSSLFQEANLEQLRRSRSPTPVKIFVNISRDNYYNYDFRNERKWTCYKIFFPGLDMHFYGYSLPDSRDAISLNTLLINDSHPSVVLDVRYPENSRSENQLEILRVVSEKWLPEES